MRDLLSIRTPGPWKTWPFLPTLCRLPDGEEECGVLFDCWTADRRPGFSATVFLTNIFLIPPCEKDFMALPREVFDTAEEMAAAGWRVD